MTRMRDEAMATLPLFDEYGAYASPTRRASGADKPRRPWHNASSTFRRPAVLDKGQPQRFNAYNSPHEDLREFIKRAEEAGGVGRIKGADWKLEQAALGED